MTSGRVAPALPPAVAAALAADRLPAGYAVRVERHWRPLAARLAARRSAAGRPLLVGISGVQGSGKSTLCRCLEQLLAADHGLVAATLSLDDLYLTRAERSQLAASVHPLFATRGVPGTHDLALADRTLAALFGGRGAVAVPRFDKARDDRAATADWPVVAAPVDILLFEGWCIGATPQPKSALRVPINRLEAEEDPEMRWRSHANTALATDYAALFDRLDLLIALAAPGFDTVAGWRQQQEAGLRRHHGGGMSPAALTRFIAHFERLTRHMLAGGMRPAEIVFRLGPRRGIRPPERSGRPREE